jgi:hypothetical protein
MPEYKLIQKKKKKKKMPGRQLRTVPAITDKVIAVSLGDCILDSKSQRTVISLYIKS